MRAIAILVGIAALSSYVSAATVVLDMNITYVENVNPDNLKARRVVGVNGKWP